MDDDFNTPIAFSVLFDLVREIYRLRSDDLETLKAHVGLLKYLSQLLGLLQEDPEQFLRKGQSDINSETIEHLIQQRLLARQNKDFAQADKIRADLLGMGVIIEDGQGGTRWRLKEGAV